MRREIASQKAQVKKSAAPAPQAFMLARAEADEVVADVPNESYARDGEAGGADEGASPSFSGGDYAEERALAETYAQVAGLLPIMLAPVGAAMPPPPQAPAPAQVRGGPPGGLAVTQGPDGGAPTAFDALPAFMAKALGVAGAFGWKQPAPPDLAP